MSELPFPKLPTTDQGKRICQVIKVRPERLDEYKKVHSEVWPEVLAALRKAHIVDYSIHYFEPLGVLIAHMRYIGTDFDKDMAGIKDSEATRRWWKAALTTPYPEVVKANEGETPLTTRKLSVSPNTQAFV